MIFQPTGIQDALGYTRVSGQGQVNGFGPERQRDDILAFASRFGFHVTRFYEEAFTGTEGERPQFMDLLATAMETGPKIIIVESLDRLARDLTIQSQLLAKLCSAGITLYAANTGEDVTAAMQEDPMRRAMIQIQGVFAELDKSLLVRKLRKGREAKKRKSGRCEGQKPYGYYEGELEVIALVAKLNRSLPDGRGKYTKIRDKVNAKGYLMRANKSRPAKPFTAQQISNMVRTVLPRHADVV